MISDSFTWGENVASQGFKLVSRMGKLVFFMFSCQTAETTGTVLKAPFTFRLAQGIVSHGTDGDMHGVVTADGSPSLKVISTKAGWMVAVGWGMVR